MRKFALIATLLLLSGTARAGIFSSQETGTSSAQFLELGVSARAEGMGEAYTAAADDANALYWNPAGIALLPEHTTSATFMHAPYLASTFYDYGAWAQNFGSRGSFGASIQSFSAGGIPETDNTGASLGSFSPYDLAFSLGYAREFDGYALGMDGKFIHSTIINSAQTEAVDLGVMSPWFLQDKLRLGFSASNLGGTLKFEDTAYSLPRIYRMGSLWQINKNWLITGDLDLPEDYNPYLALGAERHWALSSESAVAVRGGYNSQTLGQVNSFTGFTFGAGFTFDTLSFDYAFLPMGSLGNTHRISVTLKFDWSKRPVSRRVLKMPESTQSEEPTLEQPMSGKSARAKSEVCDMFNGVEICDVPQGTFLMEYSEGCAVGSTDCRVVKDTLAPHVTLPKPLDLNFYTPPQTFSEGPPHK